MARKTAKPTDWNRALAHPIKLRDGEVISTMAQAARLVTERLPPHRQGKDVWLHAADLLLKAQRTGNKRDLEHATDQLCRALMVEGWIA